MSIRINITGFRGLLKELFGKTGEAVFVEPPFHCDYGYNIEVGDNVWIGGSVSIMAGVSIGNIMVRCCKLRNNLLYFINIICVYLLSEKRLTNNLLWYNINHNYIDIRD